jgi:hypothetical protein
MEHYSRTHRPNIRVRTLRGPEIVMCQDLEAQGWTVVKRGWPTFLAWRGESLRLIVVKGSAKHNGLTRKQDLVARALKRYLGVTVEVIFPGEGVPEARSPEESQP